MAWVAVGHALVDGQRGRRDTLSWADGVGRTTIQQRWFPPLQFLDGGHRSVQHPALLRRPDLDGRLRYLA
jgi:hypothetical protein